MMDNPWLITVLVFGVVLLLMASGMWVSAVMGVVGIILLLLIVGKGFMIGTVQFNTVNVFTYTAIPLFVFMGEIILRGGISTRLYKGASAWVGFLPGGLLHTNIAASAIFAAVSGSSAATAATIGTVAIPELEKRGYDRKLLLGSLVAGGTLGILIPPSLSMIIYGAFVNESIGKLFMAGVFPGLILAGLYMTLIGVVTTMRPHLAPERLRFSPRAMAAGMLDMWPMLVLIVIVLGSLYLGLATPTEVAAVGAFLALVFCALYRRLNWRLVKEASFGTLEVTAWLMFIVIGAQLLSMGLSMLKVPAQLAHDVATLPVSRPVIFALVTLLYIALGMVIDSMSMLLLTLPVMYPVMMALGYNSIWFGVVLTMFCEMGQITPPVGINLFVIHGVSGRKHFSDIMIGAVPFFFCILAALILIATFPNIALWLPSKMVQRW